ncbi:MAG: MG2 domain-containing protein [Fimbriimonadales bacterium]
MVWRKVAHIVLGCLLLIGFQLYGIAGLVQNEPPRGSVFGAAYSERTLTPIPKTFVRLTLEEPLRQSPEPPETTTTAPEATGEPTQMSPRSQGWDTDRLEWYECGYAELPGRSTWEAIADSQGRFELRGIPAGVYTVEARSTWHNLYDPEEHYRGPEQRRRIVVREGGRVDLSLALKPPKPFLELIHPQAVYYPDEPLRVGVRGYSDDETLQLTLYRVRNPAKSDPPDGLFQFLNRVRYGWWEREERLEQELNAYKQQIKPIWSDEVPIRGRDPEGVFTQYIDVPEQAEGTYLLTTQWGHNHRVALLVVSSVGVVSKVSQEATEIWCTDLRTGQPLKGVEVIVYRRVARPSPQEAAARDEWRPIAQERTNRDGLARLGRVQPYTEWGGTLVAVHSPRTGELVHWGRIETSVWHRDTSEPFAGVLYTERPIYRPGHTIQFKGIARLGEMPNYRMPPANTPVQITVENPREEVVFETRTTTNEMGAFHASFPTSPEAETGFYTIRARVGNYGTIEQWVPLSAYRKPTYRITLKPDRTLYLPNETVRLSVQAEYYFGMPVPNTQLYYTIYRRERWHWSYEDSAEYDTLPDEEDDFYEDYGNYGEVIQTGDLTTDAAGRATLMLPTNDLLAVAENRDPSAWWGTANIDYEYTVEVYALSEGWEGARAKASFEAASSVWQASLVPDTEFGKAGTPYRYRVRLTNRRTGEPVQARLQWRAMLPLQAGDRTRAGREYQGVLQTDAQGFAEFQFTPDISGDWEITITGRDSDGNPLHARHLLWIWDDRYTPSWLSSRRDANALEVRLQKRTYAPGEPIEVAIRTPHQDAVFYLTVEGQRLYHSQVVRAQGALTRVRLGATREQIPNAYISVCMVRNKQLVQRTVEYRVGNLHGAIQVQVQPDKPRYEPREPMEVHLQTTDLHGNPVPAELSLAVVDEAIYAIREDSPSAVRRAFYRRLWNRVSTDFSAYWLALQGDKGDAESVRRDFPDTAYWQPVIRTDSRGQATVRLRLPDNITEWRLTAIAHTADTRIGYARAKVKATKDIVARLRLPMWLVEGDRTEIDAILSNETDQPREVVAELRTPDGVRTQTVRVPARNSTTVRWDYQAGALGVQKFVLTAHESGGRLRDAEERTLEIKPKGITQTDSRAVLLNTERTLTLTVLPDAHAQHATLTLRTFPSATAIALESLPYLLDYPYGCVEQTVSRFVPALLTIRASKQLGIPIDASTQQKIAAITEQSLQRLARMQRPDGGWGWWEDDEAHAWTTAYAVWGLHKAKEAGVPVPESMYRRGVEALRRLTARALADIALRETEAGLNLHEDTLPLLTLALVEPEPPDTMRQNLELALDKGMPLLTDRARQSNSPVFNAYERQVHRLLWAMVLQRWRTLPNAETHLRNLWRALQADALEDRSHIDWQPNRTDEEWYYAPWHSNETQAYALRALLEARPLAATLFSSESRYEQLVGKTVVGLALGYRNGYWYSSRDTALAVEALLAYSLRYERDFTREGEYEVWLNGQRVRTVAIGAQSGRRAVPTLRLTGLPWRTGENTLMLRPIRGTPLVNLTFEQPRALAFQDADAPVGPLQLRVYRVERPAEMTVPGERLRPLRSGSTVRAGDLLRIDVLARMPQKVSRLDYTVLETPFPAGCAPFDTEAFLTSWWWAYSHEEIRDDRAVAFRSLWRRGDEYRYTLLVRAESPGEYTLLPAHLWGMYAPYQAHSNPFQLRIVGR